MRRRSVFAVHGQVAWLLGIGMGLALMSGAYLGARVAIGGGARLIRPLFILMVMTLTLRLVWQHWIGQPERRARYGSIRKREIERGGGSSGS